MKQHNKEETKDQESLLRPKAGALSSLSHKSSSTSHLEMGLSIRPELRAQSLNSLIQEIPRIQALLLHLEGKGKSKRTRRAREKALVLLAKRTNLQDPHAVELTIARYLKPNQRPASNRYKGMLCTAYAQYCKFYEMTWEKPTYTPDEVGIQPPTDEQVKTLFSGVKNPLSLKLQISAETGLRPIEVQGEKGLQVKHIHLDQRTITAVSTKRCYPRPPMNITEELTTRLQTYITINKLQPEDQLFQGEPERYGEHYRRARNKLADKLGNPELRKIRLYDLRHYYVTKLLRKLQNTEFVRQKIGHKNLNTTQKYMHLLAGTNGEWIVEGTTDKERAKQLLATDFTYQLTTPDGTMLFKKAK